MADFYDAMRRNHFQNRLLRAWYNANSGAPGPFDERELLLMETLAEYGPLTSRRIAQTFGLWGSSASVLTSRLQELGVIERVAAFAGDDRKRNRPLRITQKGQDVLDQLRPRFVQFMDMILAGLKKEEKRELAGIMTRIGEVVSEQIRTKVFPEQGWPSPETEKPPGKRAV